MSSSDNLGNNNKSTEESIINDKHARVILQNRAFAAERNGLTDECHPSRYASRTERETYDRQTKNRKSGKNRMTDGRRKIAKVGKPYGKQTKNRKYGKPYDVQTMTFIKQRDTMEIRVVILLYLIVLVATTGRAAEVVVETTDYFYLPDGPPLTLQNGEQISLKVNTATSVHTLNEIDYYDLPVCRPVEGISQFQQNLGQHLAFQKIQNSPFEIFMNQEMFCQLVCQMKPTEEQVRKMQMVIQNGYHHNWILDNLPSAAVGVTSYGTRKVRYGGGFPVGFISVDDGLPYVYNHVNIEISYQKVEMGYRIVEFAVEPISVSHTVQRDYERKKDLKQNFAGSLDTCSKSHHLSRDEISRSQVFWIGESILYTYDVIWKERDVEWQQRWEKYVSENYLVPKQIHLYSATNSAMTVLMIGALLAIILRKQVFRDLGAYSVGNISDIENDEDAIKLGWLLLHADVFRPPTEYQLVLVTFVGTGAQLAVATFAVLVQFVVGSISPARRGSFLLCTLNMYAVSGVFGGYVSSRLYQTLGEKKIHQSTISTASFFPGMVAVYYLVRNSISGVCAPMASIVTALLFYGGLNGAMVFAGAHLGTLSKHGPILFPTAANSIVRPIPPPKKFIHRHASLVGPLAIGAITFSASYVELFYIMSSLWMRQFYYEPFFALIEITLMVFTAGIGTTLLVYLQLRNQNHRWWWFSFFCPGFTGVYMFGYSIFWFKKLEVTTFSAVLSYFGGMIVISVGVACLFGAIGFLASLVFTIRIYHAIRPRDEPAHDEEIPST
eukprot:scaffold2043_cov166-Amphora_coffeaeformis.AAC.1